MIKQITIDGNLIDDIPTFYAEINRVMMRSETWQIDSSLDAFNDLLYGSFGDITNSEFTELIWINFERSRLMLGYQVTKAYFEKKLEPGSPFNKALFTERLQALETGRGQTYFDIVLEIIGEHPNIRLVAC